MSNETYDDRVRDAFEFAQALTQEPQLPFPAAPFNYPGALHEIFAKEDEIAQLARAFNEADERRKKAKVALDQAHEQLSAMIAVIRVREEERHIETQEAKEECYTVAKALAQREMVMHSMTIASWSPEERAAVLAWARFDDPGQAPPPLPFVLASSHVAGHSGADTQQHCTQCGAVLDPRDEAYFDAGLDIPEGWFFGTGCPGKPKAPEPEPAPRRRKRDAQ